MANALTFLAVLERLVEWWIEQHPEATGTLPSAATSAMNPIIAVGEIKKAWPSLKCYTVATGNVERIAHPLDTDGSNQIAGANDFSAYSVGTKVIVLMSPSGGDALILGSAGNPAGDRAAVIPSMIVPRSRVGLYDEVLYSAALKSETSPVINFGQRAPHDLLPGDWGKMNPLGMMYFLGRFMLMIRGSESAKLEMFAFDDLVRLTAYNYEMRGSFFEHRLVDDEGESHEVWRSTPFIWEALGRPLQASKGTRSITGLSKDEASLEPLYADQMGIFRHIKLGGYLGDLEHEYVGLPPPLPAGQDAERQSLVRSYPGLLEIAKGIDGRYSVRSAKEITFEKVILIPVPKEMKAPDDPQGDSRADYMAANIYPSEDGSAKPYTKTEFDWGQDPSAAGRANQLFGYHAHVFNRYAVKAISAHGKDLFFPQEKDVFSDYQDTPVSSINQKAGTETGKTFIMPLPETMKISIDHRTDVQYYMSRSCIKQMDDGSILIEDGYGSQIFMTGGHIFMNAALDLWQMPGRNVVTWAPNDIIQRAGNSVDVSAALHDVRIKAERNLHMLGGNGDPEKCDGVGGILIECRSSGVAVKENFEGKVGEDVNAPGIIFKAAKSRIAVIGDGVHVSCSPKSDDGVFIGGPTNKTVVFGSQVTVSGRKSVNIDVGNEGSHTPENGANMLSVTPRNVAISKSLLVTGNVVLAPSKEGGHSNLDVSGNTWINGTLGVSGTVKAKHLKHTKGIHVAHVKPEDVKKQDMTPTTEAVQGAAKAVDDQLRPSEDATFGNSNALANSKAFGKIGFSCRSGVQYQLEDGDFVLYEPRWQQYRRAKGGTLTWEEPVVLSPDRANTMPHPGYEIWENGTQSYKGVDLTKSELFNYEGGYATDRPASSADDGRAEPVINRSFKTDYLISLQGQGDQDG